MDKSKWEYKKLGEVCANKKNIIRAHKFFSSSDEIIYIDISSINNSSHKIEGFTKYIVSEAPSRAQQVVVKDDVLYSLVRPNLKNIAVVDLSNKNLVASSGFCILRGEQIVSKFLYYTLLSNRFTEYILRHIAGANYPATKIEDVMNYGSYIPSISEQRIIVTELDQLNELISLKQQQLKEYDALAQSMFYEISNNINNIRKLGDICEIKSGDSSANNSSLGDLPYVKVADMNIKANRPYITTSSTFVNREQNQKNAFPIGTTIFPKRGGAILTNKKRMTRVEICCDLNVMGVIPSKEIIPEYLYEYFLTIDFSKIVNGSTIPQLNNKDIRPLQIPLPPLTLQQSFAERVGAIERQKALVKQSIAEVQTLLDSRMQEYFG